jgi:hypothetical protein
MRLIQVLHKEAGKKKTDNTSAYKTLKDEPPPK